MDRLVVHELDLVPSDFPLGPQFTLNAFSHLLGESTVSLFGTAKLVNKYKSGFPTSLNGAPVLLPTGNTALRRVLNHWFAGNRVLPSVVAEFEDTELLKEYAREVGGFAASTVLEEHSWRNYRVKPLGRMNSALVRYYAISPDRRISNSAVTMVIESAHREIFG